MTRLIRWQNCWGNRIRRTSWVFIVFFVAHQKIWDSLRKESIMQEIFRFWGAFWVRIQLHCFCFQALCVSQPQNLGDGCMSVFIGMPIWNRSPSDNKKQVISETGSTIPQTYHVNDTINHPSKKPLVRLIPSNDASRMIQWFYPPSNSFPLQIWRAFQHALREVYDLNLQREGPLPNERSREKMKQKWTL